MDAPKAGSNDREKPASGTWEEGMAEHLEYVGDSEPGGDGQEEEGRPGLSEGSDEQLDDNGKEEMQLQLRSLEGQLQTESTEGAQPQLMSRDEEELPALQGPRVYKVETREVQWRLVRLLTKRQPHPF